MAKRLQMQKGTDEINQDGVGYRVAAGPAESEGFVEVPDHVAQHVLHQGGAVDLDADPTASAEPMTFTKVRHRHDKAASFTHNHVLYSPDDEGIILAPLDCLVMIQSHGFEVVS
jgi:hypothetical protein